MLADFWTGFSEAVRQTSFESHSQTRNHCYLPIGTARAKIVLTAPTGTGGIACKLALKHTQPPDAAVLIYRGLHEDRDPIEAELGFGASWGGRSSTRVYRERAAGIQKRSDWPDAYAWLLQTATRFNDVFAPRVRRIAESVQREDPDDSDADLRSAARARRDGPVARVSARVVADEDGGSADPVQAVDALGEWSDWIPLAEARAAAPLLPGVYMARLGHSGPVIYVGMAGERAGGGRPQGIRGRLAAYYGGKGLVSGLGEAAFDRALADPAWLGERAAEISQGIPRRAKDWGREAIVRADLHVRWLVCADKLSARAVERDCQRLLAGSGLWNRQ